MLPVRGLKMRRSGERVRRSDSGFRLARPSVNVDSNYASTSYIRRRGTKVFWIIPRFSQTLHESRLPC